MMDLFEYAAHARQRDPSTAKDAARSIIAALPGLEADVYAAVCAGFSSGKTLDEICDHTGLDKVTASPRLRPLCEKGLVEEAGKRPGKSQRQQTVWRAIRFRPEARREPA